jgi:hypothetical protein
VPRVDGRGRLRLHLGRAGGGRGLSATAEQGAAAYRERAGAAENGEQPAPIEGESPVVDSRT